MDRLKTLETFVKVADRLSFAEASRQLRISPAATSRAVAKLEAKHGVQLLRRTTRSVSLTPAGELFLERARATLSAYDAVEASFREVQGEIGGSLVITAPVMFGHLHILPIVTEMVRTHGQLAVRMDLIDRNVRLVEEGVDLAVRIGDLADTSLKRLQLGFVRPRLVASPSYLCDCGSPVSLRELKHHRIIQFEGLGLNPEWRFGKSPNSSVRIQPCLTVNNAGAAIDAAKAGVGIARLLSYQVAKDIEEGTLEPVLDDHQDDPLPVSLLFDARQQGSVVLRGFIDLALARFSDPQAHL